MKSIIPVAAGILSVGALIYLYIRRREKDKKRDDPAQDPEETLEFVVRNQQVPAIVGRNSVVLKSIEEKTRTTIRFRESDQENQICTIKGKKKDVVEAKQLIDVEASKPCVITDEILVPISSCGKIEGYSGSVLHDICSQSSAKVWVDPGSRKHQAESRRVLITGTEEQVALAKKLIDEKIKEVPEEPQTDEKKEEFKREPRLSSPSQYASNSSITTTDSPRELMLPSPEKLKNNEGQLEVFVSAVNSPSRFWVQLVGPQSTELDFLVDAMTDYYNMKENQELHQIREPYLGQIVAAMLYSDNKWYRAEIVATQVNQSMPQELLFDVYFLDYGDSQFISKKDILELRADFLSLRFQAIECFLAHIQPSNAGNKLDEWDERAVEKFEEMVQAAHWKKLISKVVAYKERKSFAFQQQSKPRESSPIPGVELYDPDQNADKNIGSELVKLGLAESSDQFGDLTRSTILNSSIEEEAHTDEAKAELPVKSQEPVKAEEPVKAQEPVKQQEPVKPQEPVKEPSPKIEEPAKEEPTPRNEDSASNKNSMPATNGTSAKKTKKSKPAATSNLFGSEKSPKASKQQKTSEFLKNEQQGTFKKQDKNADWNSMLEDD